MKKSLVFLILIFVAALLISCGNNGYYDQGYEDGYAEGLSDGRLEAELELYDKRFEAGYDIGYDDGCGEARLVIEAADDYARKQTGWSVYEAYNNIMIYHDGVDPDGFPLPTKEEYIECVETLVYFSEYLDNLDFKIK